MQSAVQSAKDPKDVPVLILAFNRPDTTAKVIEAVRAARSARVFLAVDGARPGRSGDQESVAAVCRLADTLDWGCEVNTLFRTGNLGCKVAVSEAISWFFSEVEAGIILEDDCIAHPSFFAFVSELLDRYRDDSRIMMVSGNNFQFGRQRTPDSFYFSRYAHIWGWATWRRAWQLFDFEMARWPELRARGWLAELLGDRAAARYWTRIFDDTHAGRNSSWAYRWTFAVWSNGGLSAVPEVNLVSNIGFGGSATHNRNRGHRLASLPAASLRFPLRYPAQVERHVQADTFTQQTVFVPSAWWKRAVKAVLYPLQRG